MKVVLIDQVHSSFKDSFIQWGWEVIEAYQWTTNDLLGKIDEFEVLQKNTFTIEETLMVGIMFFVIYLRGFSVAID